MTTMTSHMPQEAKASFRMPTLLKDVLQICIAPAVIFVLFTFVFSLSAVSGPSMLPTYDDNTVIIGARWMAPKHGDTVLVDSQALNQNIVKRVVGLPGDTVEIVNGVVYLNGKDVVEPYVEYVGGPDIEKTYVPKGMVFVLGDNRVVSLDSRYVELGLVPDDQGEATVLVSFRLPISVSKLLDK